MRRPYATLALAVLLVLAGCNTGQATPEPADTPAPVPTDTPTPTPERVVPGLTGERVVDATRLARTHALSLRGENYTYQFEGSRRSDGRTVSAYSGTMTVGASCGTYSYAAYRDRPNPSTLTQWYANGSVALSRSFAFDPSEAELSAPRPTVVTDGGEPVDPCVVRPLDPTRRETLVALYTELPFSVEQRFNGYVLTATNGTLDTLRIDDPSLAVVTDVRIRTARIYLTTDGRIRSVSISYAGRTDESEIEGTVVFRYYDVGETHVVPPWSRNTTAA